MKVSICALVAASVAVVNAATISITAGPGDNFSSPSGPVNVGDTIEWTISGHHDVAEADGPGSCKSKQGGFKSPIGGVQGKFTYVVKAAGPIHFYCTIANHCAVGMKGTINVAAASVAP
ncbi:hypothetical protein GQ42DRAFT_173755 [Ramicandelaber brevisporus]|nr:hypothetical protein GQ42DRAFT_173755 [Ramicandelaber brevisporus]